MPPRTETVFDCHVHPWNTPELLLKAADRAGVDRMNLFSIGPLPSEATGRDLTSPAPPSVVAGNDRVIDWINQYPERFTGFCFLNPDYPSHCEEEMERCVGSGPLIGIKLWIAQRASHESVFEVARLAERYAVPLLLHSWNKATGNLPGESDSRDVAILARAFPKLPIIAAHLTGLGERGILDLAPYANVSIDTSGGDAEVGVMEFALRHLGARRILFASDFPARDYASSLARILGVEGIDAADRESILGRNFEQLVKGAK